MINGRDISVVIPVLNEKLNVETLLGEFDSLVSDYGLTQIHEVVFVDDGSSDGTIQVIKQNESRHNFHVKLIERHSRLGTVNATIVGCMASVSETVVVMDGDLQHPPHVILEMARRMHHGHDLIVASRHVQGGRNVWKPIRGVISRVAIFISYLLVPCSRKIKDPTSGFFMAKRSLVSELNPLQNRAKILLFILSSFTGLKSVEIPYTFVDRKNGTSKIVGPSVYFVMNYLIEVIGYMKIARRRKVVADGPYAIALHNIHE